MPGREQPSNATVLEAFEDNLRAWILSARERSWAEVGDEGDVCWLRTGLAWGWCNGIARARFEDATADERIEAVLAPYRARELRVSWWVGPTSTPSDLVARLRSHGLEADEAGEPGMVCDLSTWASPQAPAELTIERVGDDRAFGEWCDVFVAGMEIPSDGAAAFEERFVDVSVGEQAPVRTYLARRDGRPIATGFGLVHADVRSLRCPHLGQGCHRIDADHG